MLTMKLKNILFFVLIFLNVDCTFAQSHAFKLGDDAFLLDGKPFQMISGEMHYPRIPREAWRQSLCQL